MREWRGASEVGPAVCHRVILPCIGLGAGYLPGVVPADDINLASARAVAASRKAAHVRHGRAGAPCIGRDIINPGDIVVGAAYGVFTAEDVDIVRSWVLDCRRHDR